MRLYIVHQLERHIGSPKFCDIWKLLRVGYSPTGFQYDVFGDITPPETGKGKEIGFKVSTSDNVLNGQLTVFSIDKKMNKGKI